MSDHLGIFTQPFQDSEVILSSHTIFINASTKEITRVNNAIPSYDIAFEYLLLQGVANVDIIFKNTKIYSILICQ